jgi:hypothetical protein
MSYPINYPTPQGANIQIFEGSDSGGSTSRGKTWVKPQGASFVWFTLIGAGAAGDSAGGTGGGSGAVTNFMGPAFLMPDVLQVRVGRGGQTDAAAGTDSTIAYREKNNNGYVLLTGNGAPSNGTASAMTANYFTAMGFFQSVAGVTASAAQITASATTFLSRGGNVGPGTANYGYTTGSNGSGYFQTQPIIVGIGGTGADINSGVGCGGGASNVLGFGKGGDGLVVIITW